MTDNEIVKALECCIETTGVNCGECPYCDNCVTDENTSLVMTDALDLINRQKAEIERLKAEVKFSDYLEYETTNQIKAEAYREFAERLKEKSSALARLWIDNELKELVGEDDE